MIFSFPVARSLPLSASWLASEAKEVSFAFLEETRGNQCRALSHTLGLGVQPGILGKTGIRAQVPFGIICSGPACVSGCGQAAMGAGGCRAASWSQEGTASADLHNCLVPSLSSSSAHCFWVAALGG